MASHSDYPVRIDRRVFVEMADGVRIALTTYLPDSRNDGPFPAVLESLPYRKDDDCTARDFSTFAYLATQGIAGIRMDIRGTGASTGIIDNEYVRVEQDDNLEILEWAAGQDWCTGNLGMWGISWGGFSSLQTAMRRPPRLKAIAALHATHDRFACDVHYLGGSLHAAEQVDWPPSMISANALPPDPDIFGEGWFDEWMIRLDNTPQWPLEWLKHQRRDEYWMHGSPCADYAAIQCPTLLIGGWLDGYVDGMLAMAQHLQCPTRTVIGPWGHHRPSTGLPQPTLDHLDLMAKWFGHHLRGDDNRIMDMAPVTTFVRTDPPYDAAVVAGHWRTESAWPPPATVPYERTLDDLDGDRTTWNGPQWVGRHAPAWDRSGVTSTDGSADDEVSLTFTTAPLTDPIEILGTPEVELRMSTDRPFGLVAARLLVVDKTGASHLICRGSRNLNFPNGLSDPERPIPNEEMTMKFALTATSAVVAAGSRLRLAIAGADFPIVWPPHAKFTITVVPGESRLVIPTVPFASERVVVPPAKDPPAASVEFLIDEDDWRVDAAAGQTTFRRRVRSTQFQPDRNDLTYRSDQTWEVAVADDDPASTAVRSRSDLGLSRPGWDVTSSGSLHIGGREDLQVEIRVSATHNGHTVFDKTWTEAIPRRWI